MNPEHKGFFGKPIFAVLLVVALVLFSASIDSLIPVNDDDSETGYIAFGNTPDLQKRIGYDTLSLSGKEYASTLRLTYTRIYSTAPNKQTSVLSYKVFASRAPPQVS